MKIGLLVLLCGVTVLAVLRLRQVLRGRDKRRLLARAHGIGSNASEEFGISVLCSGVDAPERIEALLHSEYPRFEVIVVLDAAAAPEAFALLTARYRMMRVEWRDAQAVPPTGIRSLWRSRRRSCRRLVLVDRPQGALPLTAPAHRWLHPRWYARERGHADWNAAAVVAAYDYLLPLAGAVVLLPDAVTRLVAELGEYPAGTLSVVRARLGVPVSLYARERVAEAGGFGAPALRRIPRRNRAELWEPLARRIEGPEEGEGVADRSAAAGDRPDRRSPWMLSAVGMLASGGWTAATGHWVSAAVLATGAVLSGVALFIKNCYLYHDNRNYARANPYDDDKR